MLKSYPARYKDRNGTEVTTLTNDGRHLTMQLRGVTFVGRMFDDFEPIEGTPPRALRSFTMDFDCLCDYVLDCEMEVAVQRGQEKIAASLSVHTEFGMPDRRGIMDRYVIQLELTFDGTRYESPHRFESFEVALHALQAQLTGGAYIKACIHCAFGGYLPSGNGAFGDMACFRAHKAAYLAARDKDDLFALAEKGLEFVQETYLCPEFAFSRPPVV